MNKKLKVLVSKIAQFFNPEHIKKISLKHSFTRRKGKLDAETFLNLCVFQGKDLCDASLTRLCTRLEALYNISISPQALSKKFNATAVVFMKDLFKHMMQLQSDILNPENKAFNSFFNRVTIVDGTFITLPDKHREYYKGTSKNSTVKIQLQYDFLAGEFTLCEIMDGKKNDPSYIPTTESTVQKGDLCLKDLGYYKIDNLRFIENMGAYYVSKLKINANLYKKEEIIEYGFKGKTSIRKRYSLIDIYELAEPLAEGETLELPEVYIGNTNKKRFKTRLIITKLSKEDKKKREAKHKEELKRGRRKQTERHKKWAEINYYVTNVPKDIASAEQIHELYSLRWQVGAPVKAS